MRERYGSPKALESAIKQKAQGVARATGRSLPDLLIGFYFQRLLARVFLADHDGDGSGWMLKGGQSLIMRYPGQARLSRDLDLFREDAGTIEEALAALDRALQLDLDDFFHFERVGQEINGDSAKVKISLRIGSAARQTMSVDLVVCRTPTGVPTAQPMQPEIPVEWPDTWPVLRLYPLVDHIADKICAMYEQHRGLAGGLRPSSRYRDLADLLLISQESQVEGAAVQAALNSEVPRRNALGKVVLQLPNRFEVPNSPTWERGYPAEAKLVTGLKGCQTLAAASQAAEVFLTPLLQGNDPGTWEPGRGGWSHARV